MTISDKIALLFKMLEQLYPFSDRLKILDGVIQSERVLL